MISFIRENLRWLGTGFLLTFASCFGQTWFISLFAGQIQAAHGLSAGGWGGLYTVATLCSAALLFLRGALADTMPLARLAPLTALGFAAACLAMAFAPSALVVGIAVFGLRFCGQGMFTHIAMTAMGRWFVARRGRAVALAGLGMSFAEMLLPVPTLLVVAAIGWRQTWALVALVLALAVAPALRALLARGRLPRGASADDAGAPGLAGRHWTRGEAVRHWLLPLLLPLVLTPGFVATLVFFQQVHVAEVKGWSLAVMAAAFPAYAGFAIAANLRAGILSDRVGPERLLPVLLLPMGVGTLLIAPPGPVALWFLALPLIGLTNGIATALWGVFLPVVYGTRNLGALRALVTTVIVFSTAIGPGLSGLLIDHGITFPQQCLVLGPWCFALSLLGWRVRRRLAAEAE
jgi:MFS family permease